MKGFLKPNRWKVGIFLLIIVYIIILFIVGMEYHGMEHLQPAWISLSVLLLTLPQVFVAPLYWIGLGSVFFFLPFVLFVLNLLYWYLLACLIYFVFTKIKRTSLK
jgi:hypothetical protein